MFAIIDIETTGLDPQADRIFEIAILRYDGKTLVDSFCTLINPEFQLMPGIERLTGVMDGELINAPKFYQVARQIVEMTDNCILVAHHARFDYAFLRKEFSRLGYTFQRQQLCTERMSRKYVPGLSSYKLKYLCNHFHIPLDGGHRAFVDAGATLKLFQHLQVLENAVHPAEAGLNIDLRENILPPGINRQDLADLPDACGVYFFYDENDRLIYVGKSKSIRKRVFSHFSGDLKSRKSLAMKNHIRSIRYEVTGSELIALLLESDLIKKHLPHYNRSQRQVRYRYGLFCETTGEGYLSFELRRLNAKDDYTTTTDLVIAFSNKKQAAAFLERTIEKYSLCQKLCGLYKNRGSCFHYHLNACQGACIGEEPPESYNARAQMAIDQYCYDQPDFMIITKGRTAAENGIVLIKQGLYRGFAFLPETQIRKIDLAALEAQLDNRSDNHDIRKIINSWLDKHPKASLRQL